MDPLQQQVIDAQQQEQLQETEQTFGELDNTIADLQEQESSDDPTRGLGR